MSVSNSGPELVLLKGDLLMGLTALRCGYSISPILESVGTISLVVLAVASFTYASSRSNLLGII